MDSKKNTPPLPTRRPPVDQRLWPTLFALAAWAGLVVAVTVAAGGFADPRPWLNGWVRLITVGATLAALVWAAATIYPSRAQRLKLAVVVSLVVHTLLAVALDRSRIDFRVVAQPRQEETDPSREKRVVQVPQFIRDPAGLRDDEEIFDQPVATGVPAAAHREPVRQLASLDNLVGATRSDARATELPLQFAAEQTTTRRRTATSAALPRSAPLSPSSSSAKRRAMSRAVASAPVIEPLTRSVAPLITPLASPSSELAANPVTPQSVRPTATDDQARSPSLSGRKPRFAMLPKRGIVSGRTAAASDRRPAPAFSTRSSAAVQRADDGHAGDESASEADVAIALGLEFLARVQLPDGRWSFADLGSAIPAGSEPTSARADAAATGMALLALLGAGHDHLDGRYHQVVRDGLDYLKRIQHESGALFPEVDHATGQVARFYGHGIATLALAEAYGMTGDSSLRQPAQRAIDYLVVTQHGERGGWRYVPGVNSDLSVTGWQLIALRSGRLAGLRVPPETIERIRECVERCRDTESGGALFRYNPWASPTDPTTRHGREPSTVMTTVGLVAQLYLDAEPNDPRVVDGADHLLANLPRIADAPIVAPTGTRGNPERDTYYWYYGTLAMHHLGGERWETWRAELEPLLIASQTTTGPAAGSWDPRRPVPDKWAAYGGRLYVTAMNLLSLEVDARHLPNTAPGAPRMAERVSP